MIVAGRPRAGAAAATTAALEPFAAPLRAAGRFVTRAAAPATSRHAEAVLFSAGLENAGWRTP